MHKLATLLAVTACASLAACRSPADTIFGPATMASTCADTGAQPTTLRVVTYNIKAGTDSSIEEIGDVLAPLDADIVALQEVDREAERTGRVDQARALGDRLGMAASYAAAVTREGGDFGVAILSRLPFVDVRRFALPSAGSFEARVALRADLCLGDAPVHVFATHSDLNPFARVAQQEALAELARPLVGERVLVTGDLNDTTDAAGLQSLQGVPLVDVGGVVGDEPTCDGRRIDFVLADEAMARHDLKMQVIDTDASDHLPVVADFALQG